MNIYLFEFSFFFFFFGEWNCVYFMTKYKKWRAQKGKTERPKTETNFLRPKYFKTALFMLKPPSAFSLMASRSSRLVPFLFSNDGLYRVNFFLYFAFYCTSLWGVGWNKLFFVSFYASKRSNYKKNPQGKSSFVFFLLPFKHLAYTKKNHTIACF